MFLAIVDQVAARFVERGFTDVVVASGIDARNEQLNYGTDNASRVVFVPSADPMAIVPPTMIGDNDDDDPKRQLLNVLMTYEVSFAGFDKTTDRDLAHRRRCFDLFEVTAQEIHRAYYGAYTWTSARWEIPRKSMSHGAELIASLTLNIPIFDIPSSEAAPAPLPGEPKPAT